MLDVVVVVPLARIVMVAYATLSLESVTTRVVVPVYPLGAEKRPAEACLTRRLDGVSVPGA